MKKLTAEAMATEEDTVVEGKVMAGVVTVEAMERRKAATGKRMVVGMGRRREGGIIKKVKGQKHAMGADFSMACF